MASQQDGFILPLYFPFTFTNGLNRLIKKIPIRFSVYTGEYHGVSSIPYKETAHGATMSIPFNETAWWFPGLFLEENIIDTQHASLNVTENIQSLILADFELISSNKVKVSWYGNTVPSVIVMKKSESEETYVASGEYGWGVGTATIDIAGEDYNIYLMGSSNSGTSAIYTIGSINDSLVVPDVELTLNEKIYTLEIDNMATYRLVIDY